MSLKSSRIVGASISEWDPNSKEPWYFDLEKEPLNDEKWSCIVTAAIPSEAQDQDCIYLYNQCVSLGFRRAIKTITITDVIKLLKASNATKSNLKSNTTVKNAKNRKEKLTKSVQDIAEKSENGLKPTPAPFPQIVDLAAKYAVLTDNECKLPPDLMAAVIKYLILNLKNENCLQKRIEAVRERKIRERNIKAQFIRDLKPYEMSQEVEVSSDSAGNILNLTEPINDEPIDGPDLYIVLVDFYDLNVFPELQKINVPFLAILKILTIGMSTFRDSFTLTQKSEASGKRKFLIPSFWEKLKLECSNLEKVVNFKNILTVECRLTVKPIEFNTKFYRIVFEELSWTLYSVYCIYRQHQKYMKELYVQKIVLSLQPLDLSKCVVYNKLCDATITGEPLTPLLVLYAIIEQVVAGVPETKSMVLDYRSPSTDFFLVETEEMKSSKEKKKQVLVTPCLQCRDKKYENVCEKLKEDIGRNNEALENGEWSRSTDEFNEPFTPFQNKSKQNLTPSEEETISFSTAYIIPESVLDQALSEKQAEKDMRNKKKWKTPSLCFYGDSAFLQTYHCEPRLFNTEILFERFFKKTEIPRMWAKYPEPSPGNRAFFNFHFHFLKNISKQSEEVLKLHMLFATLMKLIGITKSYMYRGDEEDISDIVGGKDKSKFSRVKFSSGTFNYSETKSNFYSYFNKHFVREVTYEEKKTTAVNITPEYVQMSGMKIDSDLLHKTKSQFRMSTTVMPHDSIFLKQAVKKKKKSLTSDENGDKELKILYALLDCLDISNLIQTQLISDKENFNKLVREFKFYENFEPHVMVQRLFEAQNDFNKIEFSYLSPTDTLLILMFNDYDHRGLFFTTTSQSLPTPVNFRDFYSYVYHDINSWLVQEVAEWKKFVTGLEEKAKAEKEKQDLEYLAKLKQHYCELNEEERKIFLESELEDPSEFEVTEKELGDLSVKPKPPCPNKLSFVVTNFMDLRVEFTCKINEFQSPDGTEVNVKTENWLYAPFTLLRLRIKRSNFLLYYNKWLRQEDIETSFTFKTTSDIIFSFYKKDSKEQEEEEEEEEEEEKNEENCLNYRVTISWPTGLLIKPIIFNSVFYVKQNYLKNYRTGWDIEEEASRCHVKNGQVIIFKEYGGYDILCPSGTKYTFFESAATPKFEITSTTGEIWEIPTKGRCKNKRNLLAIIKVFIGFDTKTQEVFYKREDGVYCMLWPNGKLVTTYPDGTKITTFPEFDTKEIDVEFTEEEKLLFKEMQSKLKSEQSIDNIQSRSILKNNSTFSKRQSCDDNNEKFVSISCSYLIEHPKYSTVYFNSEEGNIRLTMPEDLSMFINPGGDYLIQKENNFLKVCDTTAEFFKECKDCRNPTRVTLYLDESEILCKCVDFFKKVYLLYRNGETAFKEHEEVPKELFLNVEGSELKKEQKESLTKDCRNNHNKDMALLQRCFAFERDLSGVEFMHSNSIGFYSEELSENAFFEINTEDPSKLCHTFSNPYYKVGYENWVMDYEEKDNSLPTNLRKKDLKELGVKEVSKNLYKRPFPGNYNCGNRQQTERSNENVEMPKLIMARTIRVWPADPHVIIKELQKNITAYQEKARDIWNQYKNHKVSDSPSHDSRHVMMRLQKIALTLNQSLQMYPHLCTQFPSTEKEIHYFGHFINSMADVRSHFRNVDFLPDCKQIPISFPRSSNFPSICEENESPRST